MAARTILQTNTLEEFRVQFNALSQQDFGDIGTLDSSISATSIIGAMNELVSIVGANEGFFIEDETPRYKGAIYHQRVKKMKNKINLITLFPPYEKFSKVNADFKCCIIRNPIERFVSAFRNRILYHRDREFNNFSIDMILKDLLRKNFTNKHFLPQSYFLGKKLDYYSFYSDVKNIKLFEQNVNDFFKKKITFPNIQIGGKNFKINLSKRQILLIEKIYSIDFELYNS